MSRNQILVFLFAFFALPLHAQKRHYVHYTTENGLPTNVLYNAIQDSSGVILINTENGLVRFNGLEFKLFNTKNGLPVNDIVISMMDNKGRVWLRPFGAKLCYYQNSQIHNAANDSLVNEIHKILLTNQTVFSADANGDMTIYDYSFNEKGKRGALLLKGDTIVKINCYDESTPRGLYHNMNRYYSFQPNHVKVFNQDGFIDSFETPIYFIHQFRRRHGTAFAFVEEQGNSNLVKFDLAKGLPRYQKLESKLVKERANFYWFYQKDKILQARKNKILITDTFLKTEKIFEEFPPHIYISGLFIDNYKNLWVSTRNDGLYFLSASALSANQILSNQVIDGVECKNSRIYYVSGSDVFYMSPSELNRHYIKTNPDIISNTVIGISDKRMVIPGGRGELVEFDITGDKPKYVRSIEHGSGSVKDILRSESFIAVAGSNGVTIIENKGNSYPANRQRVISMEYDVDKKNLLFGTMQGVLQYSLIDRKEPIRVFHEVTGQVNTIERTPNGLIWVRSNDEIYCYKNNKLIKKIDQLRFLENYSLNCIKAGLGNTLYFGTSKGLVSMQYDLSKDTLVILAEEVVHSGNGLVDNFVKNIQPYSDNQLLVVTKSGLNLLDINKLIKQQNVRTDIYELMVNGESRDLTDVIKLNYNEQFVRIRYSSLLYGRVTKYYKYRLLGLKDKWEVISKNELEFGPLNPGDYIFEIVALNEKSEVIGPVAKLPICIQPAIWQTVWFRILIILVVLSLLIWGIYRLVQRRQERLSNERTFAELKMHALKAQMNPHFIFNSLNAIQSYINEGNREDSNRYISKFSKLVRQTLNFASQDYITLQEEVDYINNYVALEKLRFGNKFTSELKIDEKINLQQMRVPPMLIQIYAENAIRHGLNHKKEPGHLQISFALEDNYLICSIDDNGVGRAYSARIKSQLGKLTESKGMNLNLDRLEMYNVIMDNKIQLEIVDKKDIKDKPLGTTVILKIPTL